MQDKDRVNITFPSLSKNETLARAFTAAYAARLDPTIREMEDVKTAVSEAVTNVVVHAYPNGIGRVDMMLCCDGDTLTVEIRDRGVGIKDVAAAREPLFTSKKGAERAGLGFTVMEAFMDTLEVESAPSKGTTVRMKKHIGKKYDPQEEIQ